MQPAIASIALLLAALAADLCARDSQQDPQPTPPVSSGGDPAPATQAQSPEAQDPAPQNPAPSEPAPPATGSPEALALARKVQDFAGGAEAWAKVDTLLFTFSYIDRIFWDRRENKVRAETVRDRKEGENWAPWKSAVYDIRAGTDVFKGGEGELTGLQAFQSAKDKWINHTFWLLVPLKVLDPGTTLAIDQPQAGDAPGIQRLRLRFSDVGMTPDNQYVLYVEAATGRITRWDFYRNAEAKPLSWTFEKWTEVGGLKLALHHNPIGLGRPIHLADVHVNLEAPDGVWTDQGRVLQNIRKGEPIPSTGGEPRPKSRPTSRPTSRPAGGTGG